VRRFQSRLRLDIPAVTRERGNEGLAAG
jgi:hypothetical protein